MGEVGAKRDRAKILLGRDRTLEARYPLRDGEKTLQATVNAQVCTPSRPQPPDDKSAPDCAWAGSKLRLA